MAKIEEILVPEQLYFENDHKCRLRRQNIDIAYFALLYYGRRKWLGFKEKDFLKQKNPNIKIRKDQ